MELEFSLRPDDYRAFARYYRKLRGGQISFSWLAVIGTVVITLAWGWALKVASLSFRDINVIIGMLIGISWVALLQGWLQACRNRSIYTSQCDDPQSEWTNKEVRLVVSPEQLSMVFQGATAMYEWSKIWHLGVTHKHLFLFITANSAIILPRRAFHDDTHREQFLTLARQYRQGQGREVSIPTGIIAGLPPQSDAFSRPDEPGLGKRFLE